MQDNKTCIKTSNTYRVGEGVASCPGSRGGEEREPGTHRSRMRLIISNFCRFLRHRRLPTAMLRNNINKLATKLLSFVGLYQAMLA